MINKYSPPALRWHQQYLCHIDHLGLNSIIGIPFVLSIPLAPCNLNNIFSNLMKGRQPEYINPVSISTGADNFLFIFMHSHVQIFHNSHRWDMWCYKWKPLVARQVLDCSLPGDQGHLDSHLPHHRFVPNGNSSTSSPICCSPQHQWGNPDISTQRWCSSIYISVMYRWYLGMNFLFLQAGLVAHKRPRFAMGTYHT